MSHVSTLVWLVVCAAVPLLLVGVGLVVRWAESREPEQSCFVCNRPADQRCRYGRCEGWTCPGCRDPSGLCVPCGEDPLGPDPVETCTVCDAPLRQLEWRGQPMFWVCTVCTEQVVDDDGEVVELPARRLTRKQAARFMELIKEVDTWGDPVVIPFGPVAQVDED